MASIFWREAIGLTFPNKKKKWRTIYEAYTRCKTLNFLFGWLALWDFLFIMEIFSFFIESAILLKTKDIVLVDLAWTSFN